MSSMKRFILTLAILLPCLSMGLPSFAAATTACGVNDNSPKGQVLQGAGQTGTDCNGTAITSNTGIVQVVVTILSTIVGIASVIMIIVSGLRYVTSGGDTNKVASAKSTLIYALVGIVVAVLAGVLVNYVFGKTLKANGTPAPTRPSDILLVPQLMRYLKF